MEKYLSNRIFVARQPVFDRNLKVWGYELLFRDAIEHKSANVKDGEYATSKVILDGFPLAQKGVKTDNKFLINFTEQSLLDRIPLLLPKERVIIEVLETVTLDKKIVRICVELKRKGYMLALDDYIGEIDDKRLFYLFDIVKLDVLNIDSKKIKRIIKDIKKYNCKVLAEKVEDNKVYKLTKKLGCDLFQGYFFSKPQIVSGTTIPDTKFTKIRLLEVLSQREDITPERLADIIKSDLSLSYKLLQFINSAAFSFIRKIDSIRDAITYLGLENIIKWCMVFLLTQLNSTPIGTELVKISVLRAYFLENLYPYVKISISRDNFFLLGMFSMLDSILNIPMKDALTMIKIDDKVYEALVGENELSVFLRFLSEYERGNWNEVFSILNKLDLSSEVVIECYTKAWDITSKLFLI